MIIVNAHGNNSKFRNNSFQKILLKDIAKKQMFFN